MPKLIKGEGSFTKITGEITKAGYRSVFVITGKHFLEETGLGFLNGLEGTHFLKSGVNVDGTEAEQAFQLFSRNNPQSILAIGGGSVIDIAKYIIYRLTGSSKPVPFFVAVPTTAGSGSEATHFAVMYDHGKKYSLVHEALLPSLVVLDPNLIKSLSSYQTAVSGMDVISQAIESFWNINATDQSKDYAKASILLWQKHFLKLLTNPGNPDREAMLEAAHLAGNAINITRTTGPHALSYYLTAHHQVPHGQAVSIFLPVFFLFNQPQPELCRLLEVKDENEAKDLIREKMKKAGLATSFAELGLKKEKIVDELLAEVNEERFANNPQKFDGEKLKQLILQEL